MLQTLDRQKALLEEYLTIPVPARIQEMKERFFQREFTYAIERDLIEARVMK